VNGAKGQPWEEGETTTRKGRQWGSAERGERVRIAQKALGGNLTGNSRSEPASKGVAGGRKAVRKQ